MNERTMLLQLVEDVDGVQPDWDAALERAGLGKQAISGRRPRPRRALIIAVVALAGVFALSAVAGRQTRFGPVYWLFDRSEARYPLLQTPKVGEWSMQRRVGIGYEKVDDGIKHDIVAVPVLQGETAGKRFELAAFFRNRGGTEDMARRTAASDSLCVGVNFDLPPRPAHGHDVPWLAGSCGAPVHGVDPASSGGESHWVGFTVHVPGPISPAGGGTGPKYMWGPAAPEVRRLDLESNDGTVLSVPTIPGPPDFDVRVRFWVAVLRLDHLVHTLVPRDAEGNELERWQLPQAQ